MVEQPDSSRAAGRGMDHAGTRIVATLGPASESREAVARLIAAGMDVARINFSHGSKSFYDRVLANVRAAAAEANRPVAVMGDLCGPKIRLQELAGDGFEIQAGQQLAIVAEPGQAGRHEIATSYPAIVNEVRVGERILIDDGTIRLRVDSIDADRLNCVCQVGGRLRSRKGVNLPDSNLQLDPVTEKDIQDVNWAVHTGVDFLALSFVRSAADVAHLRRRLDELGSDIPIVAKIETPQAVDNIDAIIEVSDVILVARGDLGVEVDVERVPLIQKDVSIRCLRAGRPVIIATQMLQSMVNSPTPTRAEVSDVANAIIDCADAVMLSAETAVGEFGVEAVRTMRRVATYTEAFDQNYEGGSPGRIGGSGVTASVAAGIKLLAEEVDAKAIVVWTQRGKLARLLSKHRLDRPVVAMTGSEEVVRRLSICFGVTAARVAVPADIAGRIAEADRVLLARQWANVGDLIIVGFGARTLYAGATGSICVHVLDAPSA